jgi:hypothetical protein
MGYRILSVGTDVKLLETRHALLASRGYDSLIATPEDVDEKVNSGRFDLVILSAMLRSEKKRRIQAKFPPARERCCWRHWRCQKNCCAWWLRCSDLMPKPVPGSGDSSPPDGREFGGRG